MKKVTLFILMIFAALATHAQLTFQISGLVLTNNYQNVVPNHPVYVVDSASGAAVIIYNYTTDANGTFTDTITAMGATGTLWFMAPDSCGFATIAINYSPNSPTNLATAGLVLCNNIVGGGSTGCNYTVSGLPVAGIPNQAYFEFFGQGGTNYLWDFGDGNSSTLPNPFHTYAQPGAYMYCLTIDSCTPVCDSIVIPATSGCDPFFIPQVNGATVVVYPWLLTGQFQVVIDWGDGIIETFTPQNIPVLPNNITHTYAAPGNYQICFTHSNASIGCSNSYCDTVTVGVGSPIQCNAAFIVDTVNSQPGTVYVWNMSGVTGATANANVDFLWNFGDGTTSTQPFPTHQYQSPGTYILCLTLTATDSTPVGGITCTSTFCDTLTVDQNGNIIYKGAIIGWSLVILDPSTIGINEVAFNAIKLYPNPAHDYFVIDMPDIIQNASLEIYALSGQRISTATLLGNGKNEIDISTLANGIYFVKIWSSSQAKTYRLVKN